MGFEINSVTISGTLVRDPELRSLSSGASVCSLRIANNQRRKNSSTGEWENEGHFFDVTIWKGTGEFVAKELQKGDKIIVHGVLRFREWEKDGQKRSAVDINAFDVIPLPKNGGGGGGGGGGFSSREDGPPAGGPPGGGAPPGAEDSIPF